MSRPTATTTETKPPNSDDAIRKSRDRVWEHRFVWLLLFAIVGLWCFFSLIGRVDNKLTLEILRQLRKEFPAHIVFLDRAHLQAGQSITIEGVRIAKPTDQGLRDVVRCGRIVCYGPIEMLGLVQGQLPVQRVVADGAELCIWPITDGRFSIQELASTKSISANLPTIDVRSGLLRIGNETGRSAQEIILHDFRAHVALAPRWVDGRVMPISATLNASVASSYFNQVSIEGTINEDKSVWLTQGKIFKLEYSQRLVNQLPSALQAHLASASGFSGELDAKFSVCSDHGKLTYKAEAKIANGRLLHPQVPYPLDSLSGDVYCQNGLLQLRNGKAASGQATVTVVCDMHGFGNGAPIVANLAINNLSLDQRLFQALPVGIQETWSKLGLSGLVDAEASIGFDGKRWTPKIIVHARNAGLEADFFPYPIRNITGDFVYENDAVVASQLTGIAADQTIKGSLTLTRAQPRWWMDLKLAADGPIVIDETLLKSLSPRNGPESGIHKFILSLHPTGTVHLKQGHFIRTAARPDSISRSLELTFSECSIKYDGFKYPISDVQGEAILDNDVLLLKDFTGRNDGARIHGEGMCESRNSNLESFQLFFKGYNVGLDEELQFALPKSVRGLWDQLQPSGVLDQVAVNVQRGHASAPLDLRVELIEKEDPDSQAAKAVSIRPISLPYQVNDIACNIVYRPGSIDIHSLSGKHDISRLQTEGKCLLHSDGTWDGMLEWLPKTRLNVDQTLLNCLPQSLKDPLLRLDFRGPVSITGTTRVSSPSTDVESIVRDWDVELQIEDGRLGGGGIASGIRGSVTLAGENTPLGPVAFGMLGLDALAVKGVAVTGVQGPFAFNRQEMLFGRDASAAWQTKGNQRSFGSGQSPVAIDQGVLNANYLAPTRSGGANHVALSSYRGPLRELISQRIDSRIDAIQRNQNNGPINPNLVRPAQDVPPLDIFDSDIRARTLSSTVFVSGVEPFDGLQRSKYRLRLVNTDFHGFLLDLGESNTQASGELTMECDLQGALTNTTSLEGQGRAWLRKADLYELPAMIRLFRLLSVSPDQGAFDSADVHFGIDGDRLPVHELVLDGKIVSMKGSGWVNLRRELHLDMFATVGSKSLAGVIFRPISSSKAARLWQIEINGTTTDPQIRSSMQMINTLDRGSTDKSNELSK